jgi:hypothetical protein
LLSFGWLAVAQQQALPGCKLVTYWGVTGCEAPCQSRCGKGYHQHLACPTNPMMKAPCHCLCVADAAKKDRGQKKDDTSQHP